MLPHFLSCAFQVQWTIISHSKQFRLIIYPFNKKNIRLLLQQVLLHLKSIVRISSCSVLFPVLKFKDIQQHIVAACFWCSWQESQFNYLSNLFLKHNMMIFNLSGETLHFFICDDVVKYHFWSEFFRISDFSDLFRLVPTCSDLFRLSTLFFRLFHSISLFLNSEVDSELPNTLRKTIFKRVGSTFQSVMTMSMTISCENQTKSVRTVPT